MKWHDYIFSFLLIVVLILAFVKMQFYSDWLTVIGEEVIRLQKHSIEAKAEIVYIEGKYQSLQDELQRVIKQNEAFEEAYYLIKEELNETKIQERKRNQKHN